MLNEQKAVLKLIKAAITNNELDLDKDFDFDKVYKIAKKHGISPIIYYGAKAIGKEDNSPIMVQLFNETCNALAISETQTRVIYEVYKIFDNNQIDYMPVKGLLLRNVYPKPEMRRMCDADILIKIEQYDTIRELLSANGYKEIAESDHELIWRKNKVTIELHKHLIPSYNKDYYSYYSDPWKFENSKKGSCVFMTDEDCFVYVFTHFAKHYRDMGIGIRNMLDIWLLDRNKELDYEYIKKELTSLRLYEFYVNVMKTLNVWFEDEPSNGITDFITEVIFNSGMGGTLDTHILSMSLKDVKANQSIFRIRLKKIMRSIFPEYKGLCVLFPCLNKFPVLLPVIWFYFTVIRIFTKGKFEKFKHDVQMIDGKKINDYQKSLNFVGLDFNFGK